MPHFESASAFFPHPSAWEMGCDFFLRCNDHIWTRPKGPGLKDMVGEGGVSDFCLLIGTEDGAWLR